MNSSWQTLSTKTVYQCPFYQVREDKVKYPGGDIKTQWVLDKRHFALVIPLSDDNLKTYFIRQFRYAVGEYVLALPAGSLEEGELPLNAAKRELSEETGIEAKIWEQIGEFFVAPGHSSQKAFVFIARELTLGQSHPDEEEGIEVNEITLKELYDKARGGEITDGPILSGLLMLEKYLKGTL